MAKKRKKSSQPTSTDAAPISDDATPISADQVIESVSAADVAAVAQQMTEEEVTATPAPVAAIVEETPPPVVAVAEAPTVAVAAPASEAAPSTARPKKKKKKRTSKVPASRTSLDSKIDRLEAKLESKKEEAAKAAREGFGSSPALDDQSVPPIESEIHDEFFAAGEKPLVVRDASGAFSPVDARHAQKMTAQAHARRAHLARYVMMAVGVAAGILVLGIGIKSMRHHPSDEPVRQTITHVAAQIPETNTAQPQQAKVGEPTVVELPDQAIEGDTEGKPEDKVVGATGDVKADETATATVEKQEEMPPEKPKNAWQEKQAAKAALERGANGAAVAAGERSIALDPSDGEAWLVLGGAYQAMGNVGQAKRCFNACVNQGKKGPIGDCRDMLSGM